MTYSLGFDGGGTKTECVLLGPQGQIVARAVAGPSNPLRAGYVTSFASLSAAADSVLTAARIDARQISIVGAGIAGAGSRRVLKRLMGFLVETFPHADVHVTNDLEVALEAAVGAGPGVVLVAGTGSAAFGRSAEGHSARAGGHGPWVGDEGSSFEIGRRAIAAVARARDQLAPVTLLSDMIPEALECSNWQVLIERIAEKPDEVFPRVFPLVLEAAEIGDGPANELLFTAALGLSQLAGSVIKRLQMQDAEFVLSKSGGVFGHSEIFSSALDALLLSIAPRARVSLLAIPPAIGAVRLATRLCGAGTRRADHGSKT